MSYCVNCGVKLEQSLKICPLCHTPVLNPNERNKSVEAPSPFAQTKGEVEPMSKRDVGIWLTIVLGTTALCCFILNITVFRSLWWSIPIVDACILLWIFFCPRMFHQRLPLSASLIASAVAVLVYEYVLTFLTATDRWFFYLVLPITIVVYILVALYLLLYTYVSHALLASILYFFIDVGVLCVVIECLIDLFLRDEVHLLWSAIVLAVCAVICAALIAALSIKRLREAVRKRLYF